MIIIVIFFGFFYILSILNTFASFDFKYTLNRETVND